MVRDYTYDLLNLAKMGLGLYKYFILDVFVKCLMLCSVAYQVWSQASLGPVSWVRL